MTDNLPKISIKIEADRKLSDDESARVLPAAFITTIVRILKKRGDTDERIIAQVNSAVKIAIGECNAN